jgi:murein L,D-transpeptidase YafK
MSLNRGGNRGIKEKDDILSGFPAHFNPFFFMENRIFRNTLPGILLLIWVLTGIAFATEGITEPQKYPSNILVLPPGGKAVVVDKTRQQLYLFTSTDNNALTLEKMMICATGEEDGNKKSLGDKRTPGGIYFCKTILIPPNLGRKYGTCALPLNYPNPMDRRNHRNGGGIWIHGIHEDRTVRSSRGCVVLENEDLIFLAWRIHLFTTPVIIDERVEFVSRESLAQEADDVLKFLEKWRIARVTGDLKTYFACYGGNLLSRGMNPSRWRIYQMKSFRQTQQNRAITIKDPMVLQDDTYEIIAFFEVFQGGNVREEGFRRLYLQKEGELRKIVAEEWIPFNVLDKKWDFYQETLTELRLPNKTYRIFYPLPTEESLTEGSGERYKGLQDFLEKWKTAWEERDLVHYLSCYSEQFRHGKMNLDAWAQYKARTFREPGTIHLTLKDIMIHPGGEKLLVRFAQMYQRGSYKDKGIKVLRLCREKGEWKVMEETWQGEQ